MKKKKIKVTHHKGILWRYYSNEDKKKKKRKKKTSSYFLRQCKGKDFLDYYPITLNL